VVFYVETQSARLQRENRDKYKSHYKWTLKNSFGLSLEKYENLLEIQAGVCAICAQKDNRRLSVDHCHETGAIRGLLCNGCNLGLGKFKDSVESLRSAIAYLERQNG